MYDLNVLEGLNHREEYLAREKRKAIARQELERIGAVVPVELLASEE